MNAIEALKQEENQSRIYRTRTPMYKEAMWHVSDMTNRIPGVDWASCCQFPKGLPKRDPYEIEVKHMIHWGRSDARIIEDAFQVSLPDDIHAFYSEIQECVLNWKYGYHILRPEDAVDEERFYRQEEGCDHLPVGLIRFCKITGSSDCIAFRKHTQTGKWQIDYASLYVSTEEQQSLKYDTTCLAEDLAGWLQRLRSSDGILHEDDRRLTAVERIA
jgi:hypothetical protein